LKNKLLITASLGLVTLTGISTGLYFGIDFNESSKPQLEAKLQVKEKNTYSLTTKQSFNDEDNYYNFNSPNQTIVSELNDREYYENLLKDIMDNPEKDRIAILPKYYYDILALGNPKLKHLFYDNKNFRSIDYQLANSLVLKVKQNREATQDLLIFSKFMQKTNWGRGRIQIDMKNMEPYLNNNVPLGTMCFNYSLLKESQSRFKALMGSLQYQLNCNDNYGFDGFNLNNFLTKFLEIGPKEIIVGERPENDDEENVEYMPLEEARRLSNAEDIEIGDKITVYKDFHDFVSHLTLDSVDSLFGVTSIFEKKLSSDNPNKKSDPIDLLKNLIEKNPNFTTKTSNTLLAILLNSLSSISKVNKEAEDIYNYDSSIKDGNIISSIINGTTDGILNLIKKLLYGDNIIGTTDFFFQKTITNNNPNGWKSVKYVQDDYEKLIDKNNNDLVKLKEEYDELTPQIDLLKQEIINAYADIDETRLTREYRAYNKVEIDLRIVDFRLQSLQNQLDSKKITLDISNEQLRVLEDISNVNNPQETSLIKLKIDEIQREINELEKQIEDTELEKISLQEEFDRLKSKKLISDYLINVEELTQKTARKRELSNRYQSLGSSITRLEGNNKSLISKNEVITEYLNLGSGNYDNKRSLLTSKKLGLLDSISLFIDVVKKTAFDALENLKLGSYNTDGEFVFKDIQFDISSISPFFKEKGAIEVVNKLIDFLNKTVDSFTDHTLTSAAKFIFSALPKSFFDLIDLEIDFKIVRISFREGIDLTAAETHGVLIPLISAGSGVVGGVTGLTIGAIVNKLRGGKKLKNILVGGGIGLAVGLIAGLIAGGTATGVLLGDGELHITKPNARLIDIIDKLRDEEKTGKKIDFNLFDDGHILLKENHIPELTEVFAELAHLFLFSDQKMLDKVISFNEKWTEDKLKDVKSTDAPKYGGWEIVGDILKMFVLSPKLWETILDRSNYTMNDYEYTVLKENVLNQLKDNTLQSKSLLKFISKNNSSEFIDDAYDLENEIISWLFDSAYVTRNTKFVTSEVENMRIGYNPRTTKLSMLESLEEEYKNLTGSTIDIIWVNMQSSSLNLDGKLVYEKINRVLTEQSKKSLNIIYQEAANSIDEAVIGLFKSIFIPVTSILNSRKTILEEDLIALYT